MKPSDPLLLADGTLCYRMYPAGKVAISRYTATPGFPQCDHTVGKLNVSYTWYKPLVGTIVRVSCAFIVSFSLVFEREYALFLFVDSFSNYVVCCAYTRWC